MTTTRHTRSGLPPAQDGCLFVGAEITHAGESTVEGIEVLPPGAPDEVLTVVDGKPAWRPASGGGGGAPLDVVGFQQNTGPLEPGAGAPGVFVDGDWYPYTGDETPFEVTLDEDGHPLLPGGAYVITVHAQGAPTDEYRIQFTGINTPNYSSFDSIDGVLHATFVTAVAPSGGTLAPQVTNTSSENAITNVGYEIAILRVGAGPS